MEAKVKLLDSRAQMPKRAHSDDAGFDLFYNGRDTINIPPLAVVDIPCGVAIEWPDGMWGFLVGRSSTFRKLGLMVNPAIIDNGFRGELFAICRNITHRPVMVHPNARVAQIVPLPTMAVHVDLVRADELSATVRGANGLGSTGD